VSRYPTTKALGLLRTIFSYVTQLSASVADLDFGAVLCVMTRLFAAAADVLNVGSIVVRAGSLSAIPGKMATLVALIACILRTFFGKMVRVAAFTTGSGGCRLLILPNGVTGAPIVIGRSIAPSVGLEIS
jgi:hypothetical protein